MSDPKVSDLLKKINAALNHSSFPALERIEYDILLKNMATLYEVLQDLREDKPTANAEHIEITEEEPMEETRQPEELLLKKMPEVQQPVFVLNDIDSPAAEVSHEKPVEEIKAPPVTEVKPIVTEPIVKQEQTEAPKPQEKQLPKGSINEGYKQTGSLNDTLFNKPAGEINKKLSSTNLKELIDLNKRILFVNDLFNGDANFYTKAIDELNSCETYEKAYTNFNWFAEQMHWKPELQATRLLLKLIKQKFQVDIE